MRLDKDDRKYLRQERERRKVESDLKYLYDVLRSDQYTDEYSRADTYQFLYLLGIIEPSYHVDRLNCDGLRLYIQNWYHAGRLQSIDKFYDLRIESNLKRLILDLRKLLADEFSKVMELAGYKPWPELASACK